MPELALDHVAVAVRSIASALALFRDALGGEYVMGGDVDGRWRWVQFAYADGHRVELLEPLGEGFLSRFLERRGEGLHHIAYEVEDLEAALRTLKEAGVQLIDEAPRRGSAGTRVAFVHPRGNRGVLTELVEVPRDRPSQVGQLG